MNYKMMGYTLGSMLKFEALFFSLPVIIALCYGEWRHLLSLLATALICAVLGFLLCWKKPEDSNLYARDGFVIVSLSWVFLSMLGALPFVFSGVIPNYIDALFEVVSGFTTTGSSILSGAQLDAMYESAKSLILWRSFTNWVGGMGVLVFVMAILPLSGAQNMHIMRAESPGPEVSKLVPRVRKTARILYIIYFVMTLALFILLLFDGLTKSDSAHKMSLFDALCTALSTAGTGGFGIRSDSLAGYSHYVQILCTVAMFMFSINFNSYYLILRLKFKDAFNEEVRAFLIIVLVAITSITLNTYFSGAVGAESFGDALRNSSFSVATILSTSGFATTDFNLWPEFSRTILVMLMFIGGCAGSTAGGIKISRIVILLKGMFRELGMLIRPKQVKKISIDRRPVDHEVVRTVNAYMVTFIIIFSASVIALSFDPYTVSEGQSTLVTNFTAVTATMNNIGPGLDMVGPSGSFAFFSPVSKVVLIFDMLAGRLELFPMLLLFSPATWKK